MAAMPIYGKNTNKYSPETKKKLQDWIMVYSIGDKVYQFVQMMVLGWPLTFWRQDEIRGNVEKSFCQIVLKSNGWNLQYMIKAVNPLSYNQYFVPTGCVHVCVCSEGGGGWGGGCGICPCPWAIYMYKIM